MRTLLRALHAPAIDGFQFYVPEQDVLDDDADEDHHEQAGKDTFGFDILAAFENIP